MENYGGPMRPDMTRWERFVDTAVIIGKFAAAAAGLVAGDIKRLFVREPEPPPTPLTPEQEKEKVRQCNNEHGFPGHYRND
jgi:hypothetical protein